MDEETNENEVNCTNSGTTQGNIEDAFSDLISEYFENDTPQNAGNIQTRTVLDWDSVANGQLLVNNQIQENAENVETNNNGILYNNLETINEKTESVQKAQNNGINGIYENLQPLTDDVSYQNTVNNVLYNEINTQTATGNPYNVVPVEENILTEINNSTNNAETIDTTNTQGTDFKLTQANLPVKIGFWTKVRNFFMSDSKISYSVQQPQANTGLWNKVQNFFSFGKNK